MLCFCTVLFFLMLRRPPRATLTDTLVPYTTLCRPPNIRWFMRYSAWKNCRVASGPCSTAVRTSPPAQKPRPSPWSTITASTAGSVRHSSRAALIASHISSVSALIARGRVSVIWPTRPWARIVTSAVIIPPLRRCEARVLTLGAHRLGDAVQQTVHESRPALFVECLGDVDIFRDDRPGPHIGTRDQFIGDRKRTRLNSSHSCASRM